MGSDARDRWSSRALRRLSESFRNFFLFDTFEGATDATEKDSDYRGKDANRTLAQARGTSTDAWAIAPLEAVQENMNSTGYASERIHYKVGWVENTRSRSSCPSP